MLIKNTMYLVGLNSPELMHWNLIRKWFTCFCDNFNQNLRVMRKRKTKFLIQEHIIHMKRYNIMSISIISIIKKYDKSNNFSKTIPESKLELVPSRSESKNSESANGIPHFLCGNSIVALASQCTWTVARSASAFSLVWTGEPAITQLLKRWREVAAILRCLCCVLWVVCCECHWICDGSYQGVLIEFLFSACVLFASFLFCWILWYKIFYKVRFYFFMFCFKHRICFNLQFYYALSYASI